MTSKQVTSGALDLIQEKTQIPALASLGGAYIHCSIEAGPIIQKIGDGYFVKRAPKPAKSYLLEKKDVESPKVQEPLDNTQDKEEVPKEDGFIEIIERYYSDEEN
ncbi:hypothetical protein BEWA_015340 [Theileria equi strain WA]|uniref:Uncharacterized protein n=1 Tax=Theileria equi strain WA TaxID=1537102 RepID=L1LCK0_THEEQ|nr:hypothetical protein BEWA_015340 [Theileria equi strain WA]EKX72975.1 hypothetical protein BEWA_015340 [Theileria equi strain WA]|eukprot:XP_004832427.1 hypothetical protein BEWA_015340 [Theileria equi strain WA]